MRGTLPAPRIVTRVLRASVRLGLSAIRAAGWRAPLLAVLGYVPLFGLASVLDGALLVIGLWLHVVVVIALARVLGAWRPEPLPAIPQVDEQGRRVLAPKKPGPPVTGADRTWSCSSATAVVTRSGPTPGA